MTRGKSREKRSPKDGIQKLLDTFADGSGYGDPEARRNAELQLQTLLAREQQRVGSRLNLLTLILVIVGILQLVILAFQIWHREITNLRLMLARNCLDFSISERVPSGVYAPVVLMIVAIVAAPYFAGQKIGPLNVPNVPRRFARLLMIVGPLLLIAVLVLLFVPVQIIIQQDCSRVRNPSAEEVMSDDSSSPEYWARDSWLAGGELKVATDQSHTGLRSFRLSATTPNRLTWHQSVRLQPHSTYRLSAWIRTEAVAHSNEKNDRGANIAIHSISPDKFPQSSEPLHGTTGEWQLKFVDFTTMNQKTDAEVLLQLGADQGMTTGTVWFDDVALKKRD